MQQLNDDILLGELDGIIDDLQTMGVDPYTINWDNKMYGDDTETMGAFRDWARRVGKRVASRVKNLAQRIKQRIAERRASVAITPDGVQYADKNVQYAQTPGGGASFVAQSQDSAYQPQAIQYPVQQQQQQQQIEPTETPAQDKNMMLYLLIGGAVLLFLASKK